MPTIHIHELHSNQAVIVSANSIHTCLWAYAHANAWDWNELEKGLEQYFRKPYIDSNIKSAIFQFATERLILNRLNGSDVWLATWEDMTE